MLKAVLLYNDAQQKYRNTTDTKPPFYIRNILNLKHILRVVFSILKRLENKKKGKKKKPPEKRNQGLNSTKLPA